MRRISLGGRAKAVDYTGDWNRLYHDNGRIFGEEPKVLVTRALKVWAPRSEQPKALDIGSYSGRNALFLARNGFHVWAMDPSRPALDDLKAQADSEGLSCDVREGFIESYDWRYTYDAIVFCGVSHSLAPVDARRTIDNMKQHTRPGGVNIVSAFTEKVKSHQKSFFTTSELRAAYAGGWEFLVFEERVTPLKLPTSERKDVLVAEFIAKKLD
jgi:2-polyprenyl-3-methyl-5-hydroxy-6-metoxy-1,4-benzoquinol methylase